MMAAHKLIHTMKKLFILLPLFFIPLLSLAQWPKTYGHNTFDAIGRNLINSYDDGIVIVGSERLVSNGPLVGYLRKTDINGVEKWKRYFSSEGIQRIDRRLGIQY